MNEKELIQEICANMDLYNETYLHDYLEIAINKTIDLQDLKGFETFRETVDYLEEKVWGIKNECH